MKRARGIMAAIGIAVVIVVGLFGVGSANAQGFMTSVRVDCVADSSARTEIGLYRDEVLLASNLLTCADGGVTTIDVATAEEPSAWSIDNTQVQGSNHGFGVVFTCVQEAGTRFPAVYDCDVVTDTGGYIYGGIRVNVMVFRPRLAN